MGELFKRVTIVGVGLIGGSLGLALCGRKLAGRVVGVGHRQTSIDKALAMGAIDEGTLDVVSGVRGADLVVLGTAIRLIVELGEQIAPHLAGGCIVSDVGSTKSEIVTGLERVLAGKARFVGAHPIAGSEKRGIEAARTDLFEDTVCILTTTPRTDPEACRRMADLWSAVGSRVLTLSPETHDAILARTSHLPHLVAASLIANLRGQDANFVGTGLRDTTRIASSDVDIWCDIALSNREAILDAMTDFVEGMTDFRRAVEAGDREALRRLLTAARDRRGELWPGATWAE